MSTKPPYRISFKDVPEIRATTPHNPVQLVVRLTQGAEMSLMLASRDPGYHTRPHYHDSEQINYILGGEIWFYVEDRGYRCVKGDVMRIPRNKIHWAFNQGDRPAVLIEAHSPPLTGDQELKEKTVPLMAEDEAVPPGSPNIHIDYPGWEDTERRAAQEPDNLTRAP